MDFQDKIGINLSEHLINMTSNVIIVLVQSTVDLEDLLQRHIQRWYFSWLVAQYNLLIHAFKH